MLFDGNCDVFAQKLTAVIFYYYYYFKNSESFLQYVEGRLQNKPRLC